MMQLLQSVEQTQLDRLRAGEFAFLDFGCSNGGSIGLATKLFGASPGLGIDIDKVKVAASTAAGYDAIVYNIHDLPSKPLVRFTVMMHFLEHIPSTIDVKAFIRKGIAMSREFVFIRQPYFDADGFLFDKKLKLYWSDWHGHPNAMTSLEFYSILQELHKRNLIGDFSICASGPVRSSSDRTIHPIGSPRDQQHYDPKQHPAKEDGIKFNDFVFKETVVLISKPGIDHRSLRSKISFDKILYETLSGDLEDRT